MPSASDDLSLQKVIIISTIIVIQVCFIRRGVPKASTVISYMCSETQKVVSLVLTEISLLLLLQQTLIVEETRVHIIAAVTWTRETGRDPEREGIAQDQEVEAGPQGLDGQDEDRGTILDLEVGHDHSLRPENHGESTGKGAVQERVGLCLRLAHDH